MWLVPNLDVVCEWIVYVAVSGLIVPSVYWNVGPYWSTFSLMILWFCVSLTLDGARVGHLHFQALRYSWRKNELALRSERSAAVWKRWRKWRMMVQKGKGGDLTEQDLLELAENRIISFTDLKMKKTNGALALPALFSQGKKQKQQQQQLQTQLLKVPSETKAREEESLNSLTPISKPLSSAAVQQEGKKDNSGKKMNNKLESSLRRVASVAALTGTDLSSMGDEGRIASTDANNFSSDFITPQKTPSTFPATTINGRGEDGSGDSEESSRGISPMNSTDSLLMTREVSTESSSSVVFRLDSGVIPSPGAPKSNGSVKASTTDPKRHLGEAGLRRRGKAAATVSPYTPPLQPLTLKSNSPAQGSSKQSVGSKKSASSATASKYIVKHPDLPSTRALMYFYLGPVGGIFYSISTAMGILGCVQTRTREPMAVLIQFARSNVVALPWLYAGLKMVVKILQDLSNTLFFPFDIMPLQHASSSTSLSSASAGPLAFSSEEEIGGILLVAGVIGLFVLAPARFSGFIGGQIRPRWHALGYFALYVIIFVDAFLTQRSGSGPGVTSSTTPIVVEHLPGPEARALGIRSMQEVPLIQESWTDSYIPTKAAIGFCVSYLTALQVPFSYTPILFRTRGIVEGAKLNRRIATFVSFSWIITGWASLYGGTGEGGILPKGFYRSLQTLPVAYASFMDWRRTSGSGVVEEGNSYPFWAHTALGSALCLLILWMPLVQTLGGIPGGVSAAIDEIQSLLPEALKGARFLARTATSSSNSDDNESRVEEDSVEDQEKNDDTTLKSYFVTKSIQLFVLTAMILLMIRKGTWLAFGIDLSYVGYHVLFAAVALRIRHGKQSRGSLGFPSSTTEGVARSASFTTPAKRPSPTTFSPSAAGNSGDSPSSLSLSPSSSGFQSVTAKKDILLSVILSGGIGSTVGVGEEGKTGRLGESFVVMTVVFSFWAMSFLYHIQAHFGN